MSVEIRQISDKELNAFVNFPFELYKNDPYWVGELKADTKKLLRADNAFWTHGKRALFMAYKDGKPAGRIAAVVNDAFNEYHKENIGFFGFFDCVNDETVSSSLFAAAETWLRCQGVTAVRGPANPSSNHVYGLLVDSFDSMPAIMMPYNYPYYSELIEKAGFEKVKDLLAFHRTKEDKFSERFMKVCSRCERAAGITLRRLDLKNLAKEAEIIREIYNKAWAENWGFVPLSKREMADMVDELKLIVRPEGTCVLEVDGVPAGFYIAIPNMNHALKELKGSLANPLRVLKAVRAWRKIKDARLIMLGVSPEFRKRGIDLILIKHIITHGVAVWNEAELSWVLEDNDGIIRGIMECGCHQSKRYRLYEKGL
ncbi:MAG: GNAT family N-acetyltransferase [Candidatus Avelusimicrobium sp.]|uniref:GNAT family N-acetyltransferase n=1 Tax=Candidatus Avelusimicrobium sp. TaxID=3048833 RepID=UPI003F0F7EA7